MENEKNLFELQLDSIAKSHLKETAKWARFLAIVGFIGLGLLVIVSIITTIMVNKEKSSYYSEPDVTGGEIVGTVIGSLIIAAIYFFPCLYLLRFSGKMNAALVADDGAALNDSLRNLKATFRFVGIVTIIFIALFLLGMLAGIGSGL